MYSYGYNSSVALGVSIGYIVGGLAVCIILGIVTKKMNESKGYSGGFAWGFWLNLIGVIVVACKPDNRSYEPREYRPMYPNAVPQQKTWRCVCGQDNSDNLNYCTRCRRTRNEAMIESSQSDKIKCPHCGAMNKKTNTVCFACNKSMADEASTEAQHDSTSKNPIEMIKQLSDLHTQGIISDEEFDAKKAELLSKM